VTRRELLQQVRALTAAPADGGDAARPAPGALPRRRLGRTGAEVSLLGLGGFHVGLQGDPAESVAIVRAAVDGGIDFLDNCWDYNGGESERRMGEALRGGYRDRVFLMSKVDGRTREKAARQLDESLRRLRTDRLDLVQVHEVIRASDPARCFAEGGAIEALVEARRAGKVRFVGFTGHKSPRWHLEMLREADAHGFAFDTVQLPLNVLDAHWESFEREVLPALLARGIGVIGMKPMGDGAIVRAGVATPEECLRYALSLPVSVVVTGCETRERVAQALRVARGFSPPPEEELEGLLARTAGAARGGAIEDYKTTESHDGTTQNPGWL